jgi:hypothetical protein
MWLRLRQIALVAQDLPPVVDDLNAILGIEVGFRDPGVKVFGLQNAVIPVGRQFIEVVSPIQEGTAGGRYLQRRGGDGGYMVITQCDDHAPRKAKVDEMGIRKVMEQDSDEYKIMQLHPADTGGSFLEIDVQVGGEDMDGPWEPAGKDWQKAIREDVVTGYSAAEIQGDDPKALAERWGQLLDIAPEQHDGEDGAFYTLALDNATLRFVEARDGRGEGLGGLDLIAVDRDKLLAAAEERGKRTGDDTVTICGMRFKV